MRGRHPSRRQPTPKRRPAPRRPEQPAPAPLPSAPARARVPAVPVLAPALEVGRWLWTCRAGFEAHLFEELVWARARPLLLGPAAVMSDSVPVPPAFGRMGFRILREVPLSVEAGEAARVLSEAARGAPVRVQGWPLDVPALNGFGAVVSALAEQVQAQLGTPPSAVERDGSLVLGQLCLFTQDRLAVGVVGARNAASLSPGGRARMAVDAKDPSRAALKLEEALSEVGLAPGRGETCVDLGAAPGGWTQRLVGRGARVIAVDPAKLTPALMKNPKVVHRCESAFSFAPEEPVDWLFCDMAWRPLEVAQLLAKWARRGWALHLVANIKLPMKDKNPVLFRVRQTLEQGGWKELRIRQLYHDRDEVTVMGRSR